MSEPGEEKRRDIPTPAHQINYLHGHGTTSEGSVNRGDGSNWSQSCGSDVVLPDAARDELLRGRSRVAGAQRRVPPRWKSAWLIVSALVVMVVIVMVTATITRSGAPPAQMQVSPVHTNTAAADGVSAPPPPVPRAMLVYREWLPAAGGWILTDAMCVPVRGSFISNPAPRAELVRYPEEGSGR